MLDCGLFWAPFKAETFNVMGSIGLPIVGSKLFRMEFLVLGTIFISSEIVSRLCEKKGRKKWRTLFNYWVSVELLEFKVSNFFPVDCLYRSI